MGLAFQSQAHRISGIDGPVCMHAMEEVLVVVVSSPTDLIISEYVEGSSNNKYIEVFNGTGDSVDLADYQLRRYSNGSSTPVVYSLTGTLHNDSVIVYSNSSAVIYGGATVNSGAANYNGDDAVSLYNVADSLVLDIFGNIGDDPGSAWTGAGGYSTANKTLRRKSSVMMGVTVDPAGSGASSFTTLTTEWDLYDQDDVSGLGSHTIDGAGGGGNAVCQNISVSLDMAGDTSITADMIDGGSTADSLVISDTFFTCADIGPNNVMLIAYDSLGNADTCTAIVTIEDNHSPVAVCIAGLTVYLDSTGVVTLDSNALDAGSYDNCGIESIEANPSSLGTGSVVIAGFEDLFISEYVEGSSSNKYIEIYNGTGVTVNLANYSLRLYGNGSSTPTSSATLSDSLNDGETIVYSNSNASAYGGTTTDLSTINFNGDDAIALYNLQKGRIADIVGVIGNDPGSAWTAAGGYSTQNKSLVRRSSIGHGILQNPTGTGPSGFATLPSHWDVYDIDDVSNLGSHTQDGSIPSYIQVQTAVTDPSGNSDYCISSVTVLDTFNSVALICSSTTHYLDSDGSVHVDALSIVGPSQGVVFELDNAIFDCSDVGVNDVLLMAWGSDGTVDSCLASLTIADSSSPVAICQDTVIYLDMAGNATMQANILDNGSFDNCGIDSFHASQTVFDTVDVGMNSIILTVFDAEGNSDSCVSTVTVVDTFDAPFVACQDITVFLDAAGMATISASDVDDGSSGTLSIDSTSFDCGETGANIVVLTATNTSGSDTCHATVTVLDTLDPSSLCADITVYLNSSGNLTIDSNALDIGSTDNCSVSEISISQSSFTVADVNAGAVTELFFSEYLEGSSNNKYMEVYNGTGATVDLSDYTIRIYGNGSATPTGSSSLSGMLNDGEVIVYGNSSATVYMDSTTVISAMNFNGDDAMELYNNASGTSADIFGNIGEDPGSAWTGTDSYTTQNATLRRKTSVREGISTDPGGSGFPTINSEWELYSIDDVSGLGAHQADTTIGITVIQTVTDASGNTATCESNVTVLDTFDNSVLAQCQDITVYLDNNGEATISVGDVDAGSSGDTISLTQDFFDCDDLFSPLTVFLVAQDTMGNTDTCNIEVTVYDTLRPNPVCMDITVFLDDLGMATIDSNSLDGGSDDNCGVALFSLSQSTFTYADTGVGPAQYPTDLVISEYVEGSSNNKYVEVYNGTGDTVDLSNYELRLYGNGSSTPTNTDGLSGMLPDGQVIVYRNSSAAVYGGATTVSSAVNFNGDDAIALYNTVSASFADIFGNIGNDPGTAWTAAGGLTTQNKTSRRKAAALDGVTTDPTGTGPSSFETYEENWLPFDQDDVSGLGSHTIDSSGVVGVEVTMTVTDNSGNFDFCTALVVVIDLKATAVCTDTTVYLDASGMYSLAPADIDGGSIGDTLFVLNGDLGCSDLGVVMIELVAMDFGASSDTCTAMVTVLDTFPPVPSCQNITVYYDQFGMVELDSLALESGSSDVCGIASITLSQSSFSCGPITTPVPSDIFISEYVEGSASNRYVEIFNGTGSAVDLSDYEFKRYSGGSTFPSTVALSGMLPDGEVLVLANPSATIYMDSALIVGNLTNNGDDALELYKVSTMQSVDIFGVIGDDPGTAWTGGGGYTTANATLRRKSTVFDGVTTNPTGTGPTAFITLTTEWDLYSEDDVSGLGSHSLTAPTVVNETVTQTVTDGSGNMAECTAIVTLIDNIPPTVIALNGLSVNLNPDGNVTILPGDIDAGSFDNCSIDSMYLDVSEFSCADVGDNFVSLYVIDGSGNVDFAMTTVTVNAASIAVAFVDSAAIGSGTGTSWADAYTELRDVFSNPCFANVDTIFIAAGTYTPSVSARDSAFSFPDNVVVMGGYPSGGGARDIVANESILCGDVGVVGVDTDNAYHVIRIDSTSSGIQIDGVTISCGYADGGAEDDTGAGVLCAGDAVLNQVTITDNYSVGDGAAISTSGGGANLEVSNSLITNTNSSASGIRLSVDGTAEFLLLDSEVEED